MKMLQMGGATAVAGVEKVFFGILPIAKPKMIYDGDQNAVFDQSLYRWRQFSFVFRTRSGAPSLAGTRLKTPMDSLLKRG